MNNHAKACLALAAVAALAWAPSAASASPELTSPTGTRAPVGTSLMATHVAHSATASVAKITTPITTIECATVTLTGTLTSNTGTHIAGEITTVEFLGEPGKTPHGAHCASTVGKSTVTPSHTVNPTHNGIASLPWCLTANTLNDKFTVRGGKCSEASRSLTFAIHNPIFGAPCSYQRSSLTATYTTHPADAVATVDPGQEFIKTTGGAFCPSNGSLDMAFRLTTDNNQVSGSPVFVD